MAKALKKGTIVSIILVTVLILSGLIIIPSLYRKYLKANTNVTEKTYLYIPTKASYEQVKDSIASHQLLIDSATFYDLAHDREYAQKIKAGKYPLKPGMNNREVLNMLIAGNQEPVTIAFRNVRLKNLTLMKCIGTPVPKSFLKG